MTLAASVLAGVEWFADLVVCAGLFVGMVFNYLVELRANKC